MRLSRPFGEDTLYIASDGYAYSRPRQSGSLWRYAHDGLEARDETRQTRATLGEELWTEIAEAFGRRDRRSRMLEASRYGP